MTDSRRYDFLSDEQLHRFHTACESFEQALRGEEAIRIEDCLAGFPDEIRGVLFQELLAIELEMRLPRDLRKLVADYRTRFPDHIDDIERVVRELSLDSSASEIDTIPHPKSAEDDEAAVADHVARIDRYRIEKVLGRGGFGIVYQAHDEQLDRLVAVKVPHPGLISGPPDAQAYLAEARTVASLDHPAIVPVYDVGSSDEFPCYVVSKYVEGTDLSTKLKMRRLGYREAAELVATVAEALHYAHKQGLVHRDVKPGNILIGNDGKAYVVDFGLALREDHVAKRSRHAGTPAYMSPEQARGEGHRVDGRSDIFSLGVVFYELLAGRRPFRGKTAAELLDQVTGYEPRPPRQYDEKVPKELERICHKAMSKRASERYSLARDLAEDLRQFLAEETSDASSPPASGIDSDTMGSRMISTSAGSSEASSASMSLGASDSRPLKIVPKGLRSFDAHDADFFLELLPGPRDRERLPDSLRFWKNRIEETDADDTFSVGLIYGPSGCGKSSLVQAGLLPRLSDDVIPVYVEATPAETESRLLNRLRRRCPALQDDLSLKDTLAALRRESFLPGGQKVVIVLDQFEQWLHANKEEENTGLIPALRQCDGGRVQCIVMVRDDFWIAVSRFFRKLEVRLQEGHNIALVDLFDIDHGRKVLAAFGRAFGRLPENVRETTREQRDFLKKAVHGLADEGKIVCVRLALFAEMMKARKWTPATLKAVGGTTGVGVTYLEETFSSAAASPQHRYHQKAARAVLTDLLPDPGTDIKGHMRSYAELLEASGYGNRPQDFDDLIRILDREIRLITPTDREGQEPDDAPDGQTRTGQRYFQLTHDYLVHSLREWLTRKQKETLRGRAELRLFDRCVTWNSRPENRFLPSWWEDLNIRLFTDGGKWTAPQRKMMSKAGRVHGLSAGLVAILFLVLGFAGLRVRDSVVQARSAIRAEELVDSLKNADTAQVPAVVANLKAFRRWADPRMQAEMIKAADGSPEKLHLSLALLPVDDGQIEYLRRQLPVCAIEQFPVVRDSLSPHKDKVQDALWKQAGDERLIANQRFQAAAALAAYAPGDDRWKDAAPFVARHLAGDLSPVHFVQWLPPFRGVGDRLAASLAEILADRERAEQQRQMAALALADFWRDQPEELVKAILIADAVAEFSPLVEALRPHAASVRESLLSTMRDETPSGTSDDRRDTDWARRSMAAVTLVRLGYGDDVWPLLESASDPSLGSFVIFRLQELQVDHNRLAAQIGREIDVSIRRALIQSLGGLDASRIPTEDRRRIVGQLQSLFASDPDPGIHGSASWALRRWGMALPEIPTSGPVRTEEQQRRFAELEQDVAKARQRLAAYERAERPERQSAWERRLREQSQRSRAELDEGLVAHFPLDEAEGLQTANLVAGQPSGLYAGPGRPQWRPGVVGNAVWLNGSGGHFSCGPVFSPERTDSFSYGCWFLDENRHGALLAKMDDDNGSRGFDLWLEDGFQVGAHLIHREHVDPERDQRLKIVSADPVMNGRWRHVMICYDGSSTAAGVTIHVDGQVIRTVATADRLTESIRNDVPFHIGMRSKGYPFRGAIDDVRVYDRRLGAEEVRQLYEAGLVALAAVPAEARTADQQAALAAAHHRRDELSHALESRLAEATRAYGRRHWYVNSQRQTMVVFLDSGPSRTLDHDFAISSHEVTVSEFRRCREGHHIDREVAPTEDCPAHYRSWYAAAEYCNWLSDQDGVPAEQWVYEPNAQGEYAAGMTIRENFLELQGYRLPTRTEWEHACRDGSSGSYCFGEPVALLARYSQYVGSSPGRSRPVESVLPNTAGLFDMHGNLWEWIQDPIFGPMSPVPDTPRGLCGGSFNDRSGNVRSGSTYAHTAASVGTEIGFRVARTWRGP